TTSLIRQPTGGRVKRQDVAVARILDGLLALHHMEPEVDGVATKDIAQPIAADTHKLQADFLGDRLQPGRAHLPRVPDAAPIPGDDEVLSPMDALPDIRHQV